MLNEPTLDKLRGLRLGTLADTWLEDSETGLSLPSRSRGLGWVPQDPMLFPHLDVEGNLALDAGGLAPQSNLGCRSQPRGPRLPVLNHQIRV